MSPIALVTCKQLPEPDPDEGPLLDACRAAGLDIEMAAWDDPGVDWGQFACAKLHSCWNYYEHPEEFRQWIHNAAKQTKLWNPPAMVLENMDKTYLGRLAEQGVPIVPTEFVADPSQLESILDRTGWDPIVLKPTVSAASYMTRKFAARELNQAQDFLREIVASREAMVQPYLKSVETGGEVSLIHIERELTHCIFKEPRFSDAEECVSSAFQPDECLRRAAARVMETVREPILYARVDVMRSATGEWLLSELELLEPTLFLLQSTTALTKFVHSLQKVAYAK